MTSITPRQALLLSLAAALSTIAMKTGAWWLTGSIGYLSDALESVVNLAGAGFALWMVSYAQRPADEFARQLEKDMDGPAMMALLKACRARLAAQ